MSASQKPATAADREAADWFARLGSTSVSTETIHAFFEWRKSPENAAAYKRQEENWKKMGSLQGDPEMTAFVANAGRSSRSKPSPTGWLVSGVVALLVAGVGVGLYLKSAPPTYHTDVGEQRSIQLADGSFVRLDTDSRIRVILSSGARRVELLEGQALFEVAHDSGRPFTVSAGPLSVTALGTVFDVRRTGADARVVLVEGRVKVEAAGGPDQVLQPNQTAMTTRQGAKAATINAAEATSWADGRLTFSRTPLREAVSEVNRYLTNKIELQAPMVENTTISGAFRAGDRSAFVSAAADTFDLVAEPQPGGAIKLVPRRTKNP
ncbi:FecR family protein [Brevundimonas sp.]|jgi:transmembrane sensor|uniref:FecR family protein n=1 Tax=Brevundimonas sp. TaxID=1871086 RepID=UPI0037C059F4